jgi:hypothetical protein
LPARNAFQLLARDGVVFYNDPASEKAGVIRLDGTVTPAAKYDPGDPHKGLSTPSPGTITIDTRPASPSASNPPPTGNPLSPGNPPPPGNSRSQQPVPPDQRPVGQQSPGSPPGPSRPPTTESSQPPPPDTSQSDPPTTSQSTPRSTSQSTTPDPPPPLELKITMSDTTPTVRQQVTLTVSGGPIDRATWSFGDGGTATGASVNHTWTTARATPFLVTVDATTTDGRQDTASASVTVSDVPKAKLTVRVSGDGVVAGSGISCPGGQCTLSFDQGTAVTLTATPGQTTTFGGWGDACAGRSGVTCQLTLAADTTASATFQEKPTATLTLRSDKPAQGTAGSGKIHGTSPRDFSCQLPCSSGFPLHVGDQVTLVAEPAFKNVGGIPIETKFIRWQGGACDQSTDRTCSFQLTGAVTITGIFIQSGRA